MTNLFYLQTRAILRKNFIDLFRKKMNLLKELAVPLISALVIYAGSNTIAKRIFSYYTLNVSFLLQK